MTSLRHFEKFCNRDLALEILTQKYFWLTILSLTIFNETENDAFSTSSCTPKRHKCGTRLKYIKKKRSTR